ncbi:MAG: GNAT family N-acetyltransferase [Ferruginibacter sp.]
MMFSCSIPHISIATTADIPSINVLLNNTYRGEASRQGWTTEADLIAGDTRADEHMLQEVMHMHSSVFLKYTGEEQITGCVNLQQHGNKLYLGMFSVAPQLQGGGIGKQLLKAAEEYAQHIQCNTIYMHVVSVRTELINWYKRHGYTDTGERKPFTEDGLTGKHLQVLEFMVMEKSLVQ